LRSRTIISVLVILGVVALLNLPPLLSRRVKAGASDNLSPFQNVAAFVLNRLRPAGKDGAGRTLELKRETLLEEVATLREQERRFGELQRENDRLRKLLGFRREQPHRLVVGEVVSRGDTSGWWQTLRINRGANDGVKPNMAVISIDGLVGRTTAVSRHTTDVLLMTDPNSKIACKETRTGALGIVVGAGVSVGGASRVDMLLAPEPARMDFVSKDAALERGDVVVTSGLGGVYPEGLPVGRVAKTEMDKSRLYQRATIMPAARLEDLRYVFVVIE
jgi:rod shape-determining protein MreC